MSAKGSIFQAYASAPGPWLRVALHAHRRQVFYLSFGEVQRDCIVLDLGDCADRDRDLALPPEVPSLEDEVSDVGVVDHEPVDLAEEMVVSRDDCARAPDLHFSLRDAVVLHTRIADPSAVTDDLGALVVGQSEHVFDADVPVRIARGSLPHAKVCELMDVLELAYVLGRAAQFQFVRVVAAVLDEIDRDEAGNVVPVLRLDNEMSHLFGDRIDDHVRELAVDLVRATNRRPQLQSHALLLPAPRGTRERRLRRPRVQPPATESCLHHPKWAIPDSAARPSSAFTPSGRCKDCSSWKHRREMPLPAVTARPGLPGSSLGRMR